MSASFTASVKRAAGAQGEFCEATATPPPWITIVTRLQRSEQQSW